MIMININSFTDYLFTWICKGIKCGISNAAYNEIIFLSRYINIIMSFEIEIFQFSTYRLNVLLSNIFIIVCNKRRNRHSLSC